MKKKIIIVQIYKYNEKKIIIVQPQDFALHREKMRKRIGSEPIYTYFFNIGGHFI